MNILFICKSNTGRSQMAAAFFERRAKGHEAMDAGTLVGERVGTVIHEYVIGAMKELGYDLSKNTRKQLSPDMVREADKVIIMDERKNLPDYVASSSKVEYWDVDDAAGTDLDFHRKTRDQIKELVEKLVRELSA